MELVSTTTNTETTEERTRVQTNINNVNIDCLEEIFKYLNLEDLLNIADSSKRLRKAASFIFACTYQPKIHIIHSYVHDDVQFVWKLEYYQSCNRKTDSEIKKKLDEGQELYTLKKCFQLLRCFGNRITFLEIGNSDYIPLETNCYSDLIDNIFSKSYITTYERLLFHANEYCHESLKKMEFKKCPYGALNQLEKPFSNVEILKTSACILKTNLWNDLFPKLRNLDYNTYYTTKLNEFSATKSLPLFGIDCNFLHLENLSVREEINHIECEKTLGRQICTAMRLNPQIRALNFDFIPDLNILQVASEHLPVLEDLRLKLDGKIIQILQHRNQNHNRIHFKSVKQFRNISTYELYKFSLKLDFPFKFDQLQEFLCSWKFFESVEIVYKFLKENKSIVKLALWQEDINMINPSELAEILPLLADIHIPFYFKRYDDTEKFINFKNTIKTLRTISIVTSEGYDAKYLTSRLGLYNLKDTSIVCYECSNVRGFFVWKFTIA